MENMDNFINTTTITERIHFLSLNLTLAKNIKSIRIENQTIDKEICDIWCNCFNKNEFDNVEFINCLFPYGFYIFCGIIVKNLKIINCGIDSNDAMDIIRGVNPYVISYLNLSNNSLDDETNVISEKLITYCSPCWCATIDLSGNCFTNEFKNKVKKYCELEVIF